MGKRKDGDYKYLIGNKFAVGSQPNKTSFKKGIVPWNTGKKGTHFSPTTEFKKGQKGIKWVPLGTITQRTEKSRTVRRWIKIEEPNIWIEYAKFIWIKHNGNIPKGFVLHHIDKDSLHDEISNLTLLTRAGHINIHRAELFKGKMANRRIENTVVNGTLNL